MINRKFAQWIFAWAVLSIVMVQPGFAIDNLRVAYPSLNTSVFSLIIAQKEGYFKEEGLNVELLSIRGEIAIRTTLAGDVDFFTNAGSALAAAVRGVSVRLITVFQDKPGWDMIALPEIKSISQLRGKNIAIMSPEGSLAVVAREILRKNGMDPTKDVNLVTMGGDEVRFRPADQVDLGDAFQCRDEHSRTEGGFQQARPRRRLCQPGRRRLGYVGGQNHRARTRSIASCAARSKA
jgi:NitT/TauT family transport system substrate-binding protein